MIKSSLSKPRLQKRICKSAFNLDESQQLRAKLTTKKNELLDGFQAALVAVELLEHEIAHAVDERVLRLIEKRAQECLLKTSKYKLMTCVHTLNQFVHETTKKL